MRTINNVIGLASSAALGGMLTFSPLVPGASAAPMPPLMVVGQIGSGGIATPGTLLSRHRWTDSGGSLTVRIGKPLTAEAQLTYVRDQLGASITDLAELLQVARPTVYSWMQGTKPRDEHQAQLKLLADQASAIELYGLTGARRLLKRPLHNGLTLLHLLKNKQALEPALAELAEIYHSEAQQRRQVKGQSVARSAAEAADIHSLPGYSAEM